MRGEQYGGDYSGRAEGWMLQVSSGCRRGKPGHWPGHWVCGQEPAEKRRQGEGKLWERMIKERMDERWKVSR